jgi:predicted DNA-binding transcriptional regulator AlpA
MLTHPPKLITRKETRRKTSLSEREQKRREAQNRFPQPLKLGEGANGRVAHIEAEIDAWVAEQIAQRDRLIGTRTPVVTRRQTTSSIAP